MILDKKTYVVVVGGGGVIIEVVCVGNKRQTFSLETAFLFVSISNKKIISFGMTVLIFQLIERNVLHCQCFDTFVTLKV